MSSLLRRIGLLHLLAAAPALAAAAATPGPAASQPAQLFIAPSGEPFRAAAGEPYPIAAWFAGADANHDGRLTSGEFVIDFARFFNTLDLNHDQQLGRDEITRYENDLVPEVRSGTFSSIDWDAGGTAHPRHRGHALGLMQDDEDDLHAHVREDWYRQRRAENSYGGGQYEIIAIPEPVLAMDTDLNRIVTRDEMRAAAQRRFGLLDTDQRGYLTLADLPETYVQQHSKRRR